MKKMHIRCLILNVLYLAVASLMQMENFQIHTNKYLPLKGNTIDLDFIKSQILCAAECAKYVSCCMASYWESRQTCHLDLTESCDEPLFNQNEWVVLQKITNAPKDCNDIHDFPGDGVYTIFPNGINDGIDVYCVRSTYSSGIWTVIQRRFDGSVDFYRNWDEYKVGFGTAHDEYWLGNDYLHLLTHQYNYKLLVILEDWNSTEKYALYDKFVVENENTNYKLTLAGYSGNAGDSFSYHNGQNFSTFDRDYDAISGNCAEYAHGGFWYWLCVNANLNGKYIVDGPGTGDSVDVMFWITFHNEFYYSLKKCSMMLGR